jgi:small subunit ribosomal protein S21
LVEIRLRVGDNFDAVVRKFKKKCEKDGLLTELRNRRFYEKPSAKRRRKRKLRKGDSDERKS